MLIQTLFNDLSKFFSIFNCLYLVFIYTFIFIPFILSLYLHSYKYLCLLSITLDQTSRLRMIVFILNRTSLISEFYRLCIQTLFKDFSKFLSTFSEYIPLILSIPYVSRILRSKYLFFTFVFVNQFFIWLFFSRHSLYIVCIYTFIVILTFLSILVFHDLMFTASHTTLGIFSVTLRAPYPCLAPGMALLVTKGK